MRCGKESFFPLHPDVCCSLAETPFGDCAGSNLCLFCMQVYRKILQGVLKMPLLLQSRNLVFGVFALTLISSFGCRNAGGEGAGQSGAGISGPLVILPQYQSRAPRTCAKVTSPPSAAVADVLVQCSMEADGLFGVGLVQDVKAEVGKPRPFVYATDAEMPGIDLDAKVYPLQGSYSAYMCKTITTQTPAGKNCTEMVYAAAIGWCYKTSFGDWKCRMVGQGGQMLQGQPQPTTF
jgi:hypothetical protein